MRIMQALGAALSLTIGLAVVTAGEVVAQADVEYDPASEGTRWFVGQNGFSIKMLVEASNLGAGEVEVGEITFPVGSGAQGGGHVHGRVEIFYILSGTFDHVVNGEAHRLTPGMVGIVRSGDEVVHRVIGDEPVRALVIWAPGGEAERVARSFEVRPIDDPPPF